MIRAMNAPRKGIGEAAIREFDNYCLFVGEEWEHGRNDGYRPTQLDILCYIAGDSSWIGMSAADIPQPERMIGTRFLRPLKEFGKQMVNCRKRAETLTVEKLLAFVVEEVSLFPHLEKISKTSDECSDRKENVFELIKAADRYTDRGPCMRKTTHDDDDMFSSTPLADFLDDVALVTEIADENAARDAPTAEKRLVVNLMTIHASKGMEFDSVFFVGLEEGTIPSQQALKAGEESIQFQEERRLAYVAMTRAKNELSLSWRQTVPIFTPTGIKHDSRNRSRFLYALSGNRSPASKSTKKFDSRPKNAGIHSLSGSQRRRTTHNERPNHNTTYKDNRSRKSPIGGKQPMAPRPRVKTKTTRTTTASSQSLSNLRSVQQGNHSRVSAPNRRPPVPQPSTDARVARKLRPIKPEASWFFPTGSKVRHVKLGVGVVVPPNDPSTENKGVLVHVKFDSGKIQSFPVHGRDLLPY